MSNPVYWVVEVAHQPKSQRLIDRPIGAKALAMSKTHEGACALADALTNQGYTVYDVAPVYSCIY